MRIPASKSSNGDLLSRNPDVLSVSQLNRLARNTLEDCFGRIAVEGEISELLQHRSGHWYFTLKDENAQLRVAMFKSANARVRIQPENGQQVLIRGQLSIYEARGSYQLIASSMTPAGEGKLQRAFELLKQKLAAEGLFDSEHKQDLPEWPRQVALVTSPQGAALRDMLTTFRRRHSGIELLVLPVAVQGESAAGEVAQAIERINQLAAQGRDAIQPDAIIVGRGGGSLEDLWAFNEEVVARAIHHSRIPVVAAIGHETDFTIADFVADLRAATPTAAAELLSPDIQGLQQQLGSYQLRLGSILKRELTQRRLELSSISNRLQHPAARLRELAMTLDHLDSRLCSAAATHISHRQNKLKNLCHRLLTHTPEHSIGRLRQQLGQLFRLLVQHQRRQLDSSQARLQKLAMGLDIVSPLATIQRGYSITLRDNEEIVRSIEQVSAGELLTSRVADGEIQAVVKSTKRQKTGT